VSGPSVTAFADVTDVIVAMGLGHLLGADGREWYNFWSGFGADLGQIALLGAAIGLYRRHNCHVKGCWRLGKQPLEHDGATWMVCHKHHPADQLTDATMQRLAHEKRAARDAESVTLPD
jgi:hypothetical protein